MSGGGEEGGLSLEYTPTWIVAAVCTVFVFVSLVAERQLHFLGKLLKSKNQKPLFDALLKVKEELMLLGFISLLLTVFQGLIHRICIPEGWTNYMLPCRKEEPEPAGGGAGTEHYHMVGVLRGVRRLMEEGGAGATQCHRKGRVPLLSVEALHSLHIFIFVLAITHVIFSVLTVTLGGLKIRQWKHWEESIHKEDSRISGKVTHVHQFEFIQNRFKGSGTDSRLLSWIHSFGKQFYGSVTKSDYATMRLGFIMTHCRGNPKFDFHKYMMRALEADFKKVVGISWYLWVFVVVFLLLNVNGWHTFFWIASVPLLLLLAVGTKLEHVISQLARDVAEKHSAIQGDLVVKPSDEHFWFNRPKIVLHLIHFILFQNAFEIAFFFWILTRFGMNSCIMGPYKFIIPRLIIGAVIQILCSYSTLPLYAIVTQMGSSFKKAIFEDYMQESLIGWAQTVKKRKGFRVGGNAGSSRSGNAETKDRSTNEIQGQNLRDKQKESMMEEGRAGDSESIKITEDAV